MNRAKRDNLLPPDDTLVLYKDAALELGVSVRSVNTYCRQGRLQRHHSRRGVTRDSIQSYVGDRQSKSWSATPRLAQQVAAKLIEERAVRLGWTKEKLSFVVFQVLSATEVSPHDQD